MEEGTLRIALVVAGLACLALSIYSVLQVMPLLQEAAHPFLTPIFCAQENGTYTYAAPTTAQLCGSNKRKAMEVDASLCAFYPEARQKDCNELVTLLNDRYADCLTFVFLKQTDYADGAPKVTEICARLAK